MNEEIAEFLGWYFGDGCLSTKNGKFQFFLTGDLKEELEFYNNIIIPRFNQLFGSELKSPVKIRKYSSVGVCGIYVFQKDFVKNLQKKYNLLGGKKINVNLPRLKTKEQKKCFLRGLFDTDGSIYFGRSHFKTKNPTFCTQFHYKPTIKLATISKEIIDYVYILLKELGFSPRLYKPTKQRPHENTIYPIVLNLKEDVNRWIDEVGFLNPKHNTKVRLWKTFGFCPPYTTIKERVQMLNGKISPRTYYLQKKEKNL